MSLDPLSVSDATLIEQARRGEHESFDALVRRHMPMIRSVALARLRDPDAADDLAQEVFLRAFLHLDELKRPDRFAPWVARIARNLALNWLRDQRRRSELLPQVPFAETPDTRSEGVRETMENRERENLLLKSLERLPNDQREVVVMHFAEGMTKREIAGSLGVHESTVGRQLKRALKKMRGAIESALSSDGREIKTTETKTAQTILMLAAVGGLSAASKSTLAASASVGALGIASPISIVTAVVSKAGAAMTTGKAAVAAVVAVAAIAGGVMLALDTAAPPPPALPTVVMVSEPEVPYAPVEAEEVATDEEIVVASLEEDAPVTTGLSRLRKFVRDWGRVTDEHGNPINGALVYITGEDLMDSYPLMMARTGPDGRFEFVCAYAEPQIVAQRRPGSRTFSGRLVAEHARYARSTRIIRIKADPDGQHEYNFELAPAGMLTGEIVWDSGEPVANAAIAAVTAFDEHDYEWMSARMLDTAQTDEEGRFRLEHLAVGDVTLGVRPEGGRWHVAGDYEVNTEWITAELTRPTGAVAGRLIGAVSQEPIVGREISMGSGFPALVRIMGRRNWVTVTGPEGEFHFDSVPMDVGFSIFDTATGVGLASVRLRPGAAQRDRTLLLPEERRVAGTVINNVTGEPIPNISLELIPPDPWLNVTATSDAEGWIDFGVTGIESRTDLRFNEPQCTVRLMVDDPNWLFPPPPMMSHGDFSRSNMGQHFALEQMDDLTIRLEPCDQITVQALDPEGRPIAGADLQMACDTRDTTVYFNDTDSQGRARVPLPASPGHFQIYGEHEEWPMIVSPVFERGSREVVAQALPTTSAVVTVVDIDGEPMPGMSVVARDLTPILWREINAYRHPLVFPVTNEHGQVTFDRLPRSPHRFSAVEESAGMPLEFPWQTLPNATADLTDVPEVAHVTVSRSQGAHRGVVYNAATGDHIAGAEIRWDVENARFGPVYSGADGRFELPGDERVASENFIVTAEGFAPRRSQHVTLNRNVGPTGYSLYPIITLQGVVRRPDGTAPPVSPLYLFAPTEDPWGPEWTVIYFSEFQDDQWTHLDGSFSWVPSDYRLRQRIDRLPVWLMVLTDDGEVATADTWIDFELGNVIDLGELTLLPGSTVKFYLQDTDEQPVSNVRVEFEDMGEMDPVMSGGGWRSLGGRPPFAPSARWAELTGETGWCELQALPLGKWRFALRREGRRPEVIELDVLGDMEHTVTLSSDTSMELVVSMTGFDGEPMTDVMVALDRYSTYAGFDGVNPDSEGIARYSDFPPGEYFLSYLWMDEGRQWSWSDRITVPASGMAWDVDMSRWGTLMLHLVDNGVPEPSADVRFVRWNGDGSGSSVVRLMTDAEGGLTTSLPPGSYRVTADAISGEFEIELDASMEITLGD